MRKRCLLNYKPEKWSSCIPPYEAFTCDIVISLKGTMPLVGSKPDKFQVMGTVLLKEQNGDELEATLAERFKLHNKFHKSYVYQETTHKCHFIEEPEKLPEPTILRPRAFSEENGSLFSKREVGFHSDLPPRLVPQEPQIFNHPSVSQLGPPVGGVVFLAAGQLCNLRQKAKQHDELIKQINKTMLERDEAQLQLREQVTENTIVSEWFSKLEKELKKSKLAKSAGEEGKRDDFSMIFFEDYPCNELPAFKQPTAISLTMTVALTFFSSVFYIVGRYFGYNRNC